MKKLNRKGQLINTFDGENALNGVVQAVNTALPAVTNVLDSNSQYNDAALDDVYNGGGLFGLGQKKSINNINQYFNNRAIQARQSLSQDFNNTTDILNAWNQLQFDNTVNKNLGMGSRYASAALKGAGIGAGIGVGFSGVGAAIGAAAGAVLGSASAATNDIGFNTRKNTYNRGVRKVLNTNVSGINNAINRFEQQQLSNILNNYAAEGGQLYTNGAVWSNGLNYIGNGGSHEQNPFQGIQIGVDSNGIPNLVEEGETLWNNYVFSKRLNIPDEDKKVLGIKSKDKINYADASMMFNDKEHTNDPITQNYIQDILTKLQMSQEALREKQRQRKEKQTGEQIPMNTQMMNVAAYGGNIYSGELLKDSPLLEQATKDYINSLNIKSKLLSNDDYKRIYEQGIKYSESKVPDDLKKIVKKQKNAEHQKNNRLLKKYGNDISDEELSKLDLEYILKANPQLRRFNKQSERNTRQQERQQKRSEREGSEESKLDKFSIGSLASMLDALNKSAIGPNYNFANEMANTANRLRYVSTHPVSTYSHLLQYKPMDVNYYLNKANAEANARRRMYDSTNPSSAAAQLAADWQSTLERGDIYRQAEQQNLAQRLGLFEMMQKPEQFNAQMGLEASKINAGLSEKAAQIAMQAAAAKQAIRDTWRNDIDESFSSGLQYGEDWRTDIMKMKFMKENPALFEGNKPFEKGGYLTSKNKKRR